jgi:hypothetical protein
MARTHVQPFRGRRVHPAAENAPARKHQRMLPVIVDDGQFEIAGKGRSGNFPPHPKKNAPKAGMRIDLNHMARWSRKRRPAAAVGTGIDLDQTPRGRIRR